MHSHTILERSLQAARSVAEKAEPPRTHLTYAPGTWSGRLSEAKYMRRVANNNKVRNAKCDCDCDRKCKCGCGCDTFLYPSPDGGCGYNWWLAQADLSIPSEFAESVGLEPRKKEGGGGRR